MTREDIMTKSVWEQAKLKVFSNFFGQEVTINLHAHWKALRYIEDDIVSKTMVSSVNDFLNMTDASRLLMKKLLYEHCMECCENSSYGFEKSEGETEKQANLRAFGIKTEDDALSKAYLNHITIEDDELEQRKNRYVRICFYPEWESEHGCELVLKNGELLDFSGEQGTYLTQFED